MTLLTSPAAFLLLRTTLLLSLALLAVRLLRRRGPAVQTLAGRAALAAVALLLLTAPLTKFVPPLWHVSAPAAPRPAAPVVVLTPTALPPLDMSDVGSKKWAGAELAPTQPLPLPAPLPAPVQTPSSTPPELGAGGPLLLLWATGTTLLLLWLAVCQTHLTRLRRRAVPLTDGPAYDTLAALTPTPPRLLACPGIDGPFLAGLLRPAIYLPADHAETFSPDALRAVLAHELAHAGRHDTRWTLASRLLCALLWPQPLLWLLCRRLDHLSEDACDLAVLAHACPPRVYADCLLTLAERRPHRRMSPLTAGLVPFRSQLARRVQHILAIQGNPPMPAVTRRLRFALPAAAVLAVLGGTLLIAAPAPRRPFTALPQAPASDAATPAPLTGAMLLAGLTPVQGPGIIVTLRDSKKQPPHMPASFTPPNLIHDTDIASVVNELKAAGAEAISINGQRLVATSPIRSVGPAILINNTPQAAPFVIQAIGNPKTLLAGIELPGGVTKYLRAYDPAMFTTKVSPEPLRLPAYTENRVPRYARPASTNTTVPAGAPHWTLQVNFRVPHPGTHHIQIFVKDDTGQRSIYDKMCPAGTMISVPVTVEGEAVTFHIYNDSKLIYTSDKTNKAGSSAATNDVGDALLAKRSELISQLNDAEDHSGTLGVTLKTMRQQFGKRRADMKPPQPPVTQTPVRTSHDDSIPTEKAIEQQAAQHPVNYVLKKQQFVLAVHKYSHQWIELYNQEANAEAPLRRSLAKYQNKQRRLQTEIVNLDAQIANIRARKARG